MATINTPLAYPGQFDLQHVYTVSYPGGNLVSGGSSVLTNQKLCSSVNHFKAAATKHNHPPILVTTSPVDCFMAVSIIRENEEPTIFYLKLADYKDIVAAKAFLSADSTEILLLLVDSSASLIRIRIPTDTFLPRSSIAIQLTDLIDSSSAQPHSTGVSAAMVDFGSADLVVVALNPYLFSIDLHTHRAYQWTLKTAKPRSHFSLSTSTVEQTPMKPIAAVSVVDPTTVYTLDSAGLVHRWGLSRSQPVSSQHLTTNHHIPDPGYWRHPILMCGKTYNGVRVLAIFISSTMPVDDTSPGFDQSRRAAARNVVCVIDESMDGAVHAIRLQVPDGDVVSMEFDPSYPRCRLKVQFADQLVIFPPSNLAMVSREPIILRHDQEPQSLGQGDNNTDKTEAYDGMRQLFWTPGRTKNGTNVLTALEKAETHGWNKLLARERPLVCMSKDNVVIQTNCIVREHTVPPFLEHAVQASAYVESSELLCFLEQMARADVDKGTIALNSNQFKDKITSQAVGLLSALPEITFSTLVPNIPAIPQAATANQQRGNQIHAAAWDLSVQYLHVLSRLFLVRWLQVVQTQNDQRDEALREYLFILSALQVCLRHVDERQQNPVKRLKSEPLTILDVLLHRLDAPNPAMLATAALTVILGVQVSPGVVFPEIGLLGDNIDPYYVLRLVAPCLLADARLDIKRLAAQCLIRISSHHDEEDELELLQRAFQLVKFDSSKIEQSLEGIRVLEKTVDSPAGYATLFLHISAALTEISPDDPNFVHLWNANFNVACKKGDWATAAKTAEEHPTQKEGCTKRLVRMMVDAGALNEVLSRCNDDEEMGITVFYDLAVEALAESCDLQSDWYSCPTKDRDDHLLALFSIHCKLQGWRSAAQVMALRYSRAKDYLLSCGSDEKNRAQAWDDLVESSQLTVMSILQVDEDARFVQEGQADKRLSIEKGSVITMRALRGRVIRSRALRSIFNKDGLSEDLSAGLCDDASVDTIEAVFGKLCELGLYKDALTFASSDKDLISENPEFFLALLLHLLSGFIIPLTGSVRELANVDVSDIEDALSLFSVTDYTETRSKRVSELEPNRVRTAALILLRTIIETFNSKYVPLATNAAREMLAQGFAYLPSWLEQLLMFGNLPGDRPGLFALRRKSGEEHGFLGDPVFLLDLYTKLGRLCRACIVVESVLGGKNGDYRMKEAASRLPESGEMDFVPYQKITYLMNLMEKRISSPTCDAPYGNRLKAHLHRLEASLSQHHEFLKLSEAGLASARTLL